MMCGISSARASAIPGRTALWALASVGVLICCLLLTGFSYLVFVNIDHLFQTAYEQNVVAVYLDEGLEQTAVEQVGETLRSMDNVAQVTFVSKEESLERYGDDLPAETYESLQGEDNPAAGYLYRFAGGSDDLRGDSQCNPAGGRGGGCLL